MERSAKRMEIELDCCKFGHHEHGSFQEDHAKRMLAGPFCYDCDQWHQRLFVRNTLVIGEYAYEIVNQPNWPHHMVVMSKQSGRRMSIAYRCIGKIPEYFATKSTHRIVG